MINSKSEETTGYHLFLEPEGSLKGQLEELIYALSVKHSSPIFIPHVTLLARIEEADEREVVARAELLAKELSPFLLRLGRLNGEPSYFRALYIQIQNSVEVEQAHTKAMQIFDLKDNASYTPHLSLLYGNIDDPKRNEILANLVYPQGETFLAQSLHVYRTYGRVGEWRKISEIRFGRE